MNSSEKIKKIAILYDCPYPFVLGGGQKRLYEIATRLVRQENCSVDWYSLQFWEGKNEIEHEGIRFFGIGKKTYLYEEKTGKRRVREALEYSIRIFPKKRIAYVRYYSGRSMAPSSFFSIIFLFQVR